jgi:CubicO group peptidase (beta-lactamase class C family)
MIVSSFFRKRRVVSVLAAALVLFPAFSIGQRGHAEQAPVHIKTAGELSGAISRVDQIFAAEFAKDNPASLTVGVISGPNLVWTKSYGLADIEKKTPATKESEYRIGSITKQFTGVMLLQLADKGKVHLSDPVEKYYPEIHKVTNPYPNAAPITLIELATHTSGLDREPGNTETYLTGQVADWEKTLLAALGHTSYTFEPGTHYSYSNIGYAILGAALGRAAGQPYIQYVREHILEPLGMKRTAFEQNADILSTLTKGYVVHDGAPDPTAPAKDLRDGRGYKIPNGALFTTVGDLAKFVSFEMGDGPETVLKKSILADNRTRASSTNGTLTSGYGIGFMLSRRGDLISVGHGGSVAGYQAGAYFNPPSHTGVIFFRNDGRGFRNDVIMDVLAELSK